MERDQPTAVTVNCMSNFCVHMGFPGRQPDSPSLYFPNRVTHNSFGTPLIGQRDDDCTVAYPGTNTRDESRTSSGRGPPVKEKISLYSILTYGPPSSAKPHETWRRLLLSTRVPLSIAYRDVPRFWALGNGMERDGFSNPSSQWPSGRVDLALSSLPLFLSLKMG